MGTPVSRHMEPVSVLTGIVPASVLCASVLLVSIIGLILWARVHKPSPSSTIHENKPSPSSTIHEKLQSVPRSHLQGALVQTARAIEKSRQSESPSTLSAQSPEFCPDLHHESTQKSDSI